MTLRIIGDVHQDYDSFLPLLRGADHVLQVGDLGLNYRYLREYAPKLNWNAIGGNHDCYQHDSDEYFRKQSFFLDDFGVHEVAGFPPIFYCRGAWSIDGKRRRMTDSPEYPTWWEEEELTHEQFEEAIRQYARLKPRIVVTHEGPLSTVSATGNPSFARAYGYEPVIKTRTNQAFEAMLDQHRPELWIFGHMHRRWEQTIEGTQFVCLDMLRPDRSNKTAYIDLETGQFQ